MVNSGESGRIAVDRHTLDLGLDILYKFQGNMRQRKFVHLTQRANNDETVFISITGSNLPLNKKSDVLDFRDFGRLDRFRDRRFGLAWAAPL